MLARLFLDHPRALGMGWTAHGAGAFLIGLRLIGAGLACFVHALVPRFYTETAGRTVADLHGHMQRRRSAASDPHAWPDYEI